jgi:hypothetical protein
MADIVISGNTSGSVTLRAPDTAGTTVLTLPTTSGTLIVSGGAQTIEFADGTVSAPSITNSGDTNTGIYFPAADTIAFTEGGVESMRIDSSGNLLVGTTSASGLANKYIDINDATDNCAINLKVADVGQGYIYVDDSSNEMRLAATGASNVNALTAYTGGSERMRISSAGNVLIGSTTDNGYRLKVVGGNASNLLVDNGGEVYTQLLLQRNGTSNTGGDILVDGTASTMNIRGLLAGAMTFQTSASAGSPVERMRIDSAGKVGIGTSSPGSYDSSSLMAVASNSNTSITVASGSTGLGQILFANGTGIPNIYNGLIRYDHNGNAMSFFTNGGNQRMIIDSAGTLLMGCTGGGSTAGGARFYTDTSGDSMKIFNVQGSSASITLLSCFSNASTPSNPTGTIRFNLVTNGGIQNFSANNVNLSDIREKTDIELADGYLDKICAIPVKTFNYIDQNMDDDQGKTLGVIAQDVELIAPELIKESNWGTKEEPKMRLSIYQTDLQYALMKAIQEQQAIITDLKARIETLETK